MPTNTNKLVRALHYATDQHRNQRRKDEDASPYINHPISLLHILNVEAGIEDNDVLIAALLHDVIEDCSGPHQMHIELRRQEIREQFGEIVLSYVEAVSDDKALSTAERKLAQVEHAAHIPYSAKLVKIADKTANLRDISNHPPANWSPERKTEYFAWAKQVVDVMRGNHAALEALFDQAHSQQ